MTLPKKLDILIRRKNYKKIDFAKQVDITYRSLANYLAGNRVPKHDILTRIARALETDPNLLTDDTIELTLTSEERFLSSCSAEDKALDDCLSFIKQARKVFGGSSLAEQDKQSLFSCLTEIYFDEKSKTG
ncbi:MAG: helix-turn-helix domain-containing protein [Oscillospiraceae bacterium]|jgi:transcriptional regulator with XRE-family HTH domain|nr:helix-turn-helix domain-containing protein [Oscillospiraceae bacterium]